MTAANRPSSSSLDPLETSDPLLIRCTATQAILHRRFRAPREKVILALSHSNDATLITRAFRLGGCCQNPAAGQTASGRIALALFCCRDRLCPRCQRARGIQCALRAAALVRTFNAPRFITLTQADRQEDLGDALDRLARSFKALRKTDAWKANVKGGVYAVEVTRNVKAGTWHCHLHIIADGHFWAQADVSKLWYQITGDSMICDIRAVPDREKAAKYIAEYVAKPANVEDWEPAAICDFALALHGRRMLHTFGVAHGQRVEPSQQDNAPEPAESIITASRFRTALQKGNKKAAAAAALLARMGPAFAAFAGIDAPPARNLLAAVAEPLDLADHAHLNALLRGVALDFVLRNGEEEGWMNKEPEPDPFPLYIEQRQDTN